jgi:hypothetical protein
MGKGEVGNINILDLRRKLSYAQDSHDPILLSLPHSNYLC